MKKILSMRLLFLVIATAGAGALLFGAGAPTTPKWSFNATIIEACSCPMFCPCYFGTHPSDHHEHGEAGGRFCKFNNAFKVNKGGWGSVKLDGAKFWVAGDLGAEFADGEMDWAVLTFDPSVTQPQRDAITKILGSVYPVRWKSFTTAKDATMEWTGGKDRSVAKLDGGKTGEVVLNRNQGMTNDPIVIKNLKYWGVPRNDGFVLMQNDVDAYRIGDKPFEFKGTNGFMITVDINSDDAAATSSGAKGMN